MKASPSLMLETQFAPCFSTSFSAHRLPPSVAFTPDEVVHRIDDGQSWHKANSMPTWARTREAMGGGPIIRTFNNIRPAY
jgi:hypothetical protein